MALKWFWSCDLISILSIQLDVSKTTHMTKPKKPAKLPFPRPVPTMPDVSPMSGFVMYDRDGRCCDWCKRPGRAGETYRVAKLPFRGSIYGAQCSSCAAAELLPARKAYQSELDAWNIDNAAHDRIQKALKIIDHLKLKQK